MTLNLIGMRFGGLVAIAAVKGGRRKWECRCDCGKTAVVRTSALTTGNTKTCGCSKPKSMSTVGKANRTHGQSRTSEYRSWARMIHRCYVPADNKFHQYGAVGVTVCDRWRNSFEAFLADMGLKPVDKPTIDRYPNNDGNYEPTNCRWASYDEQNLNRRPFKRNREDARTATD